MTTAMEVGRSCERERTAFTLVEVLVVVVIIGLLAAAIVPSVVGRIDEAKVVRARADVRSLATAVRLFKKDTGRYPTQQEGLGALLEAPPDVEGWRGYLEGRRTVPRDPWGNEYHYFLTGGVPPFEIVCYGADGRPDGEGDAADISSAELDD
ncbi:MAG: type II secretion system major pseudopilin GspG [Longimicrobiales bacterium]